MGAISTATRYALGGIMSGTLNFIWMYLPLVIVIAVIVFLVLGMLLPHHMPVTQNYKQDLPMQNN